MAKKIIKRFMPDYRKVRDSDSLKIFGTLLHDPNLFHLNRRSVSMAFAIGLFMAFVPMPFQMIPATACAIMLRANLVISVALVWISNPITIPPIFYFCYLVGTWILQTPENSFAFEPSVSWLMTELAHVWEPFLLGCFVVSSVCSIAGYTAIRLFWRWHVVTEWEERKKKRKE